MEPAAEAVRLLLGELVAVTLPQDVWQGQCLQLCLQGI